MRLFGRIIIFVAAVFLVVTLAGCVSPMEAMKCLLGKSTKGLEDARKDALVKVFDYDYATCYAKTEALLKKMTDTSIYAKNKGMIAVFYLDPDTTPVGVFFKEIDPTHTQVEVSSESTPARDWIAKNVFSETVLTEVKPFKTPKKKRAY